MDLTIKNVPEDDIVIAEILSSAESTIRNYHAKIIFKIDDEKQTQFNNVVSEFRAANVRTKS
jgi:hypothetical protein